MNRVDVVVVGAGTAGAHVAGQFAQRGRSVVMVDRRPADQAGAQWHNGVLAWQFAEAGVAAPVPDEVSAGRGISHFFSADGHHGCSLADPPTVRADMGALGASLREVALEARVELIDRVASVEPEVDSQGRMRAITVSTGSSGSSSADAARRLEADLFVDASGRAGVLRRHSPVLRPWCSEVTGAEQCSATDQRVRVADADGARRFLERYSAAPGDSVAVLGYAGGWSTRVVSINEDLTEATVLVGCIADGRHGTGPRLFAETLAELSWLGDVISGGSGVIPLRRPYARFTAPGLALVGDSACQVFPGHGSGIGFGLIAGRMLAESTADAADCGDEETLWRYQHGFQEQHGGLLAAVDAFRRMSTALGTEGVARMISAGLLDEDVTRAGMDQRWAAPSIAALPGAVMSLVKAPSVAKVMVPRMARAARLRGLGARYPEQVDIAALGQWETKVERLLGPLPVG